MERQEKAFKELKERFTNKPVLATLDLDKKKKGWKWIHLTILQEECYL